MIDSTLVKLILLYAMDKMEVALEEDNLMDLCCNDHEWLNYMECRDAMADLEDVSFIHKRVSSTNKYVYNITPEGRMCLANFYTRIPFSLREEINDAIKETRVDYRRRQEYISDYYQNNDGTFTVFLKILGQNKDTPIMELKIVVDSKQHALFIHKNWKNRASNIYSLINDNLFDS